MNGEVMVLDHYRGAAEGPAIEPGLLKLFSGVTFRNSGVLGGDGTVEGMTCCTNPQVVNNGNTGKIDGSDGITLLNLRLLNRGKIAGGSLHLVGGDHIFRTGSRLVSVDVTAETARISVPDDNPNARSSVTLANQTIFTVTGGSELYGPADWIGNGILEGGLRSLQLENRIHLDLLLDDLAQLQRGRLQDLQALLHLRPDGELLCLYLLESLTGHGWLGGQHPNTSRISSSSKAQARRQIFSRIRKKSEHGMPRFALCPPQSMK